MSVTKTFAIHYRPSSANATEPRFWGNDGELHNGLDQTITFPMNRELGSDVVWTVSYNTAHHGPSPLGCRIADGLPECGPRAQRAGRT